MVHFLSGNNTGVFTRYNEFTLGICQAAIIMYSKLAELCLAAFKLPKTIFFSLFLRTCAYLRRYFVSLLNVLRLLLAPTTYVVHSRHVFRLLYLRLKYMFLDIRHYFAMHFDHTVWHQNIASLRFDNWYMNVIRVQNSFCTDTIPRISKT